ncbi:MAG TPA: MlaD family protein [Pirellulales bacterium]|jgi:phospholipid/cholesterol/gamma-HCH transport system substrate-binding protein|nr:MlaD family protein [Pirellulales bacterium]
MNERVVQFRVGVMVLATVFITAILVVLFDGFPNLVERPYTVYVDFPEAPDISVGTPVRKSGILIGRVSKVQFAEDLDPKLEGVVITLQIDANRQIRRNEVPKISKELLGDAYIQLVPARAHRTTQPPKGAGPVIQPGEMVEGETANDPLKVISDLQGNLAGALRSVAKTSDEIGLLSRRVNDILRNNNEQMVRVINKAELTLDSLQETSKNANLLVGDPALRNNVLAAAAEFPRTVGRMNEVLNHMQNTFESADRNLRNFEGLTKPLGERGAQLVQNIETATAGVNRLVGDLSVFTRALNSPEGTIGHLLKDDELYQQVNQTIANVNQMMCELQPMLRDARAFTDKIARHPELIGVGGALRRSSGIK